MHSQDVHKISSKITGQDRAGPCQCLYPHRAGSVQEKAAHTFAMITATSFQFFLRFFSKFGHYRVLYLFTSLHLLLFKAQKMEKQ